MGSLLLFPEFDNRPGSVQFLTVTNTSLTAGIVVEIVYIDGDDCSETNRLIPLTPGDTFTRLTSAHNPEMERGYAYAFGFEFFDGTQTPRGSSSYSPYDVTVTQDGCASNGGEGGSEANATIFEFDTPLVPVLNVQCNDCGNTFPEQFGSPLTSYPAWLR